MKKCMFRSIFVIGLLILLIGASIIPLINAKGLKLSNNKNIFLSELKSKIIFVPDNYSKIQDAIDNVTEGFTIFIRNGIYNESLWIDKSISLIGQDKYNTIIEGTESYVINLADKGENGINITGFTIQNGWEGILSYYPYNNISNNIINNTDYGIRLETLSAKNYIYNNLIINSEIGISLDSYDNVISGNKISSEGSLGIQIRDAGFNNTIINNYISDFEEGFLIKGFENRIISNKIKNCEYGININLGGYSNKISENIIDTNKIDSTGINVKGNDNIISCNSVKNNYEGIHIAYQSNLIIKNNIKNNINIGIHLSETWTEQNIIIGNNINDNSIGIYLRDASMNKIYCNNFIDNEKDDDSENGWNKYFFNYWNRPQFIKIIKGRFFWPDGIDFFPAREPFNFL